jgi:hypothetical protein
MNRLAHQPKEIVAEQPAKPHTVRRAIRYRAADNARQAIRKQFPEIFGEPAIAPQELPHNAR